jgi:hypothetical protein
VCKSDPDVFVGELQTTTSRAKSNRVGRIGGCAYCDFTTNGGVFLFWAVGVCVMGDSEVVLVSFMCGFSFVGVEDVDLVIKICGGESAGLVVATTKDGSDWLD